MYSRGARCPPYGNLKEKLTLCALMFFLSKLLPLFIYPLGLVCVLMGLALLLFWKRPRWAIGSIALALTVLLVTGNGWFAGWLVRSLEWQYIPTRPLAKAEAIVVLGGLGSQLGVVLAPHMLTPADTIGFGGFHRGLKRGFAHVQVALNVFHLHNGVCLLYTSPSPRD